MLTKYNNTRTLIDYNPLPDKLTDTVIVCVNLAVLDILRKLVIDRGLWSITYVKENYEFGYTRPTDEELAPIFEAIAGFISDTEGNLMDICTQLLTTLQGMSDALDEIAAKTCCSTGQGCDGPGSGGAGPGDAPPVDFDDEGTNYPDGFDDREDYEEYKCHVANVIREGIAQDAGYLETAGIAALTSTALALGLLTPIPGVNLLVFAGFLTALALEGVLTTAADDIETNLLSGDGDELICALYDATSVTNAETAIRDWGNTYLSTVGNGVFEYFINYADLNRLFEKNAIAGSTAVDDPTDCICSEETEWEVTTGTGDITTDGEEFTITAVLVGSNYDLVINAVEGQCDVNDCLTIVTWDPPGGSGQGWLGIGNWQWDEGDCPNTTRTVNQTFPTVNTYQSMMYAATRTVPFTMTFTITPGVCP